MMRGRWRTEYTTITARAPFLHLAYFFGSIFRNYLYSSEHRPPRRSALVRYIEKLSLSPSITYVRYYYFVFFFYLACQLPPLREQQQPQLRCKVLLNRASGLHEGRRRYRRACCYRDSSSHSCTSLYTAVVVVVVVVTRVIASSR